MSALVKTESEVESESLAEEIVAVTHDEIIMDVPVRVFCDVDYSGLELRMMAKLLGFGLFGGVAGSGMSWRQLYSRTQRKPGFLY